MTEREVFVAAFQIEDPTGRDKYLSRACADNTTLRSPGERAPGALGRAGGFLWKPRRPSPTTPTATRAHCRSETPSEIAGTVIGPYQLIELIGDGRVGGGLAGRAAGAGQAAGCPEGRQGWYGLAPGAGPVRGRVPGVGSDGAPEHCPRHRRRGHALGPVLLRDGVGQGHADHELLRREAADAARTSGVVRPCLPGDPARPPEGDHPPRHQTLRHHGYAVRRQAGAQGDRLRGGQSDRTEADGTHAVHAVRHPALSLVSC